MGYFQEQDTKKQKVPYGAFGGEPSPEALKNLGEAPSPFPKWLYAGTDYSKPAPVVPPVQGPTLEQATFKPTVSEVPQGAGLKFPFMKFVTDFMGIPKDKWKEINAKATTALGLTEQQLWQRFTSYEQRETATRQVLSMMDPNREIANWINKDFADMAVQATKPGEQPQMSPQDAKVEMKRQQLRGLYAKLRDHPMMGSWWGVIAFVLLSLTTKSPRLAAQIVTMNPDAAGVEQEISGLQHEIDQDERRAISEDDRKMRLRSMVAGTLGRHYEGIDRRESEIFRIMQKGNQNIANASSKEAAAAQKMLISQFMVAAGRARDAEKSSMDPFGSVISEEKAKNAAYWDNLANKLAERINGSPGGSVNVAPKK